MPTRQESPTGFCRKFSDLIAMSGVGRHDESSINERLRSIYAASGQLGQVIPVLKRQKTEPDFFLKRSLPATARHYREDFHQSTIG